LNVLDLFSGIGGFSLGLERAGMRTVAFCEIDPYARAVLRKHWPDVPQYDDVRTLTADRLAADGIAVDVICGGFPCQDISFAGKGAGLEGERSGLWSEIARLVGELRPRFVFVENVSALLARGLGDVLGDLASLGYDAEWHCIPASAVGAPHRRDRVWIVAYPNGRGQQGSSERHREAEQDPADRDTRRRYAGGLRQDVADPHEPRLEGWLRESLRQCASERTAGASGASGLAATWLAEPDVGRVANGVPKRVDRLRCLGNAVVPQIPEIIGRAIMRVSDEATAAHCIKEQ
jgi:DNA (cytosine-5)-methyltransferase 1